MLAALCIICNNKTVINKKSSNQAAKKGKIMINQPKKIYKNQILIGNLADAESLTLTSNLEYAKSLELAGPIVAADGITLTELVRFYRESFPALALTVATNANAEALEALDNRVSVAFDGSDPIHARGMKIQGIALAKLRFATIDNVVEFSRKAVRELLADYPRIDESMAVAAACETSSLCDEAMLAGYAKWFISTITERVIGTMTINDSKDANTVRSQCHDNDELVNRILSLGGNYIHIGSQGSGKTQMARKLVKKIIESESENVLVITHRRTITDSFMSGMPGVVHYEHVEPGSELNMRALVICVNSIIRPNLQAFLDKVGTVIIEEANQTLRHIASGTVDRRAEVRSKLNELVRNAHTNLMMDADSSNKVLRLIRDNKSADELVNIIEKPLDFSKITIEINRYEQAEGMIERMVVSGPVAVATDSKRKVGKLRAKIRKEFPDFKEKEVKVGKKMKTIPGKRKMLTIHSDNVLGEDQSNFIKSPNSELDGIDALIYSPAITSSLSITNPRYENHVGLFAGIAIAQDDIQMLRRNRPCTHFTVGLRNPVKYLPDTAEKILAGTSSISEFDRWAAEIEADDNYIRNHFQAAFYIIAKQYGFNVVIAKDNKELAEKGKNWETGGTMMESNEARKQLLNAHAASYKASEKRTENAGETTEKTAWAIERARLEKAVGTSDITKDDVKAWGRGILAAHISNLEILRSDARHASLLDKKDISIAAFRDKRRIGEHRESFRMIFRELGIDPFTGKGEFTVTEANLLLEKIQLNLAKFNSLKLMTEVGSGEVKSGTTRVKSMIFEFGFEVIWRDGNKKNGRKRKYSICPKSFDRMNRYLVNRARKQLMLVNPEFSYADQAEPTVIEVKSITKSELETKVAEQSAESEVVISLKTWKSAQVFLTPVALNGMEKLIKLVNLKAGATSLPDELKTTLSTEHKIIFRQAQITKTEAFGKVHVKLLELPESVKQKLSEKIAEQYEKDQLIPI